MRVLYLFNTVRRDVLEKVKRGEESDDHFFGMLRLARHSVEAGCMEIEDYFPKFIAGFLRRFINMHYIHLFIFPKLFFYDVVFTSTAFGTQFIHTLLHIRRPKWVMYDYNIRGFIGEGKTLRQKLFKWMAGRCGGIISLSQKEADWLKKTFPQLSERIQFIPFGTDLSFFKPNGSTQEVHQVLTVGLAPDRDYQALFSATKGLGVRVVATRSRKIDSFTELPNYVETKFYSPRELVEEYQKSKIVVLPLDISSGQNNASGCSTVVEAMAMGKAVIATRTPTIESYITNGVNGVLIDQGDIGGLSNAIKDLLNNDAKRVEMGKKAREFVEQNCSAEIAAERVAQFFNNVI